MQQAIDELHHLITDLEGEGHTLAGRFRDVADRVKADLQHLSGGGKSELDAFVQGLIAHIRPELAKVQTGVVTQVKAEVHKMTDEVKTALESATNHPAPAPAPVEPPATAAPAQG